MMIQTVKNEEANSLWDYCKGAACVVGAGCLAAVVTYVAKQALFPVNSGLELEPVTKIPLRHLSSLEATAEKTDLMRRSAYPYLYGKPFPTSFPVVAGGADNEMFSTENCDPIYFPYIFTAPCDNVTPYQFLNFTITGHNGTALPTGVTYSEQRYLNTYRSVWLNATKATQTLGNTNFEFRVTNQANLTLVVPFTTSVMDYTDSIPHLGVNFPNLVNYATVGTAYELFVGQDSTYVYSPIGEALTFTYVIRSADLSPHLVWDGTRGGYDLEGTMGSNPVYLDVTAAGGRLQATFTISVLPGTAPTPSAAPKKGASKSGGGSTAVIAGAAGGGGAALLGLGVYAYLAKTGYFKKNGNKDRQMNRV